MQIIKAHKYGGPEVLLREEKARPQARGKQLCIQIMASSVNQSDLHLRRGQNLLCRFKNGIIKPRRMAVPGLEFAGKVHSVGPQVTAFKAGDRVMAYSGAGFGGYAQFKCLTENEVIVKMPENLNYLEAACLPYGALAAWHLIEDLALKDQKVLICGAAGSVGNYALQLCQNAGAEITVVSRRNNHAWLKKLGAQKCLDYREENFWESPQSYDLIIDAWGQIKAKDAQRVLSPKGPFRSVSKMKSHASQAKLQKLADLVAAGKIQVFLDSVFPWEEVQKAHRKAESGEKAGHIALKISPNWNPKPHYS